MFFSIGIPLGRSGIFSILILGFLELYEEECSGKDPESCSRWFREAYGILDRYLEERGNTSLRFLYFKALKGSE